MSTSDGHGDVEQTPTDTAKDTRLARGSQSTLTPTSPAAGGVKGTNAEAAADEDGGAAIWTLPWTTSRPASRSSSSQPGRAPSASVIHGIRPFLPTLRREPAVPAHRAERGIVMSSSFLSRPSSPAPCNRLTRTRTLSTDEARASPALHEETPKNRGESTATRVKVDRSPPPKESKRPFRTLVPRPRRPSCNRGCRVQPPTSPDIPARTPPFAEQRRKSAAAPSGFGLRW